MDATTPDFSSSPIYICAAGWLLYPNLLDPDSDSDPDFDRAVTNSIWKPPARTNKRFGKIHQISCEIQV
jgi:hypothetical protein